ncbi:MAG: 2-succinyl-6-hydroxy-2,4-cyclohexadiene-1-carboxylate synthase [Gemmatimonadales bacterium]|nr:MAG: 2-succinyl-6-hydroxy-2,4-cyclohexadiene-1-carboxylate synthase [Gemmatimonadales bacterium]
MTADPDPVGGLRVREVPPRGSGRVPLVLLHGFTGSGESWGAGLVEGLSEIGPLLVVDLPGHGRSQALSPVDPEAPPRFEEVVGALAEIPGAFGYRCAHWIGYSMGGRLALAVAIESPVVVSRLVLEGASPGLATERECAERRRHDAALADRIIDEGVEAFVSFWMDLPLFESQKRMPESKREAMRRIRMRNEPHALAAVLRGMGTGRQPSYWDDLAELTAPVLLVTGSLDTKFEAIARQMQRRLPRGERVSLPGAGHTTHFETPTAWLESVHRFLVS